MERLSISDLILVAQSMDTEAGNAAPLRCCYERSDFSGGNTGVDRAGAD